MSLADASQLLGVSSERVRQLVVAGDLPGVRFGNAWAVPSGAVAARRQVSNRRGRPLGEKRAWFAIRHGEVDLSNVSRYRKRGEVERYAMSAADVQYLMDNLGAIESGVAGARSYGQLLQVEGAEIDLYVPSSVHARFGAEVAAVQDPLGSIAIRVVSDEMWPEVQALALGVDGERLIAPPAAVALDLMDSGDARHWVAASNLAGLCV